MSPFFETLLKDVLLSVIFGGMGIAIFVVTCMIFGRLFPLKKEIEEDQNTALAILMGSIMIGIAIILAAAIK